MALKIADCVDKPLHYELVDFHSSRPGHDLRYTLSGDKMKRPGWEPRGIEQRLDETVQRYLRHRQKPKIVVWITALSLAV